MTLKKTFNIISHMNIKQALKEKNKLAKKITDLLDRTNRFNSMDQGGHRSYDPKESLREAMTAVEELVQLKTKIHMANMSVYEKIFRMAEYKSAIKYLKILNCTEGVVVKERYGDSTTRHMTTVVSEVERDQMVEQYESMIDEIQSELDAHNATTSI